MAEEKKVPVQVSGFGWSPDDVFPMETWKAEFPQEGIPLALGTAQVGWAEGYSNKYPKATDYFIVTFVDSEFALENRGKILP